MKTNVITKYRVALVSAIDIETTERYVIELEKPRG
jgi:hypothetical protein